MKPLLLLAAAIGLGAGAPPAAAPVAPAQAKTDWTKTVVATPEGGFRMGNPNARVKLVEYGSLTCPHCAHFDAEGMPTVMAGVKSGRISYEFRNFVLNQADMGASLLVRCAGTKGFFPALHAFYAGQPQWLPKAQEVATANAAALDAMTTQQRVSRLALLTGLDTLAARHGITAARARQCLADEKALGRLVEMRRVGSETYKLHGTPSFIINGKAVEGVHDWAGLKPLLGLPGG